jgi:diguanylate cyclase (GGDEF)-like protein
MPSPKYSREMSLNDAVGMFGEIYFQTQNYGKSKFELFTHFVKVFGGGSRYLFRVQDPVQATRFLAKLFAWYCALAYRLGLDVDSLLWSKYPGVCPRCLKPACGCGAPPQEIDQEQLDKLSIQNLPLKPRSIREWQNMFSTIYRGPEGFKDVPPSRERIAIIFARMAEEMGEVAEAILMDGRVDPEYPSVLRNEMADLLAWIFSLVSNLHSLTQSAPAIFLADIVWVLYPGKCSHCHEPRCLCVRGQFQRELAATGALIPSHWDPLTGLANASGLHNYAGMAKKEYADIKGMKVWAALFFDIDNFGQLNKTYGQDCGDLVLHQVAQEAAKVIGKEGVLFRRGGEEFVSILRGVQQGQIQKIGEEVRIAIEKLSVAWTVGEVEHAVKVTVSVGVASTMGPATLDIDGLQLRAEEKAREAKTAGKNRVMV